MPVGPLLSPGDPHECRRRPGRGRQFEAAAGENAAPVVPDRLQPAVAGLRQLRSRRQHRLRHQAVDQIDDVRRADAGARARADVLDGREVELGDE
ncbi:hypothetical protein [Streptomyces sp. GQFP]|uniref:hypothetical protein n=1 Tax=Streptomyces sp. GQFP TaxID=2907545 RepID=UPI001F2A9C88|nr:hypothetical protein [Streptomyces sp. GQFP]UIX28567.1 hypothetical protein LUX31_00175 [Streptomyces sp. GQFP]